MGGSMAGTVGAIELPYLGMAGSRLAGGIEWEASEASETPGTPGTETPEMAVIAGPGGLFVLYCARTPWRAGRCDTAYPARGKGRAGSAVFDTLTTP